MLVRSDTTEMETLAGMKRLSSGSRALTLSTVSITLACGCLVIRSSTAGLPLNQPAARVLRTPWRISATSPNVIATLLRTVITTRAKSSNVCNCALVASISLWRMPSNVPKGPKALALTSAKRTASMLMPMLVKRDGSTRTLMAGCSAPLTVTSATPLIWAMRWAMTLSAMS